MSARVPSIEGLRVKIFADGADKAGMLEMAGVPYIAGFTTNPTLMRKAGVADYAAFARDVLAAIPDRRISFEVFSDDFAEMERQAREIASWGPNVYVKIPVTNTRGEPALRPDPPPGGGRHQAERHRAHDAGAGARGRRTPWPTAPRACVSVFAGRIADTGRDPVPADGRGGRAAAAASQRRS